MGGGFGQLIKTIAAGGGSKLVLSGVKRRLPSLV